MPPISSRSGGLVQNTLLFSKGFVRIFFIQSTVLIGLKAGSAFGVLVGRYMFLIKEFSLICYASDGKALSEGE